MIKIGSKLIIFVIYYVVVVVDYFSNKSDIILIDASFLLFLISLPCNTKIYSIAISFSGAFRTIQLVDPFRFSSASPTSRARPHIHMPSHLGPISVALTHFIKSPIQPKTNKSLLDLRLRIGIVLFSQIYIYVKKSHTAFAKSETRGDSEGKTSQRSTYLDPPFHFGILLFFYPSERRDSREKRTLRSKI